MTPKCLGPYKTLRQHMKEEHPEGMTCKRCNKVLLIFDFFMSHIASCKSDHILYPHKCHHCIKTFKDLSRLQEHIQNFHSENKLKCQNCEKVLESKQGFKIHKCHTPKTKFEFGEFKEYKCEKCLNKFST